MQVELLRFTDHTKNFPFNGSGIHPLKQSNHSTVEISKHVKEVAMTKPVSLVLTVFFFSFLTWK
uniref:Uncharacterized protein n=1 Tax=Rhizophora mucronata TaxID=61149 RepID=A0A2P2PRD8_RHIMU